MICRSTQFRDITEAEIKEVVMQMPKDKAPGPDGFTGAFFAACWEMIKHDIQHVFHQISQLRGDLSNLLNTAKVVLIPKKERSAMISDYRPISLIHSLAKIFSKILSNRLAGKLPDMVSQSQSPFVQKRCLHDNYILSKGS